LRAAVKQAVGQARTNQPVETAFSEDLIWVHGDGKRLEQIFTHVISNGLKYSPPDMPVVVAARLEQPHARVVIDVADRGPGIPQHLRKDLFERGNPGDAQRSGGLGVGLFLARTVVEAHGGHIGLQSSPSEGTTVTIVLPV
jgi:signal transduction histidine kinase